MKRKALFGCDFSTSIFFVFVGSEVGTINENFEIWWILPILLSNFLRVHDVFYPENNSLQTLISKS